MQLPQKAASQAGTQASVNHGAALVRTRGVLNARGRIAMDVLRAPVLNV